MFLEPAPATKWVVCQNSCYRCSLWRIVQDPIQDSSVIIKRHPLLQSLYPPMQKLASYVITEHQVEAAAPNALLFQPPPPSVTVCYRNYEMSISRAQGLTFGAVVAELDALREKCWKKINELVKRPCTLANRREYARNMEVLGGPGHGDVHGVVPPSQWIGLEVENAEDEYSEPVCVAREARCLQTSWEETCLGLKCHPRPRP
jgi:hypothetical protein